MLSVIEICCGAMAIFVLVACCHAFCMEDTITAAGATTGTAAGTATGTAGYVPPDILQIRDRVISTTADEWRASLSKWVLQKAGLDRQPSREKTAGIFQSKGETLVRDILEQTIYPGRRFPNIRPDWLKNPDTQRNLELDCYNRELRVGVEIHGRQHYEYTPSMHGTQEDFRKSQTRDALKRSLCARHGVLLIEVPYTETTSRPKAEAYLRSKLNM